MLGPCCYQAKSCCLALACRQHSCDASAFVGALAAELARRWREAPYVKSSFSSKDFADLAEALATLFGGGNPAALAQEGGIGQAETQAKAASRCSGSVNGSGNSHQGGAIDAVGERSPDHTSPDAQRGGSSLRWPTRQPLEPAVAALLDELAGEVRRQLSNKHARSPWAPPDLVRLARSYASLAYSSPRTAQMLDALASFAVQRIRSRHLNCISRPADLTGERAVSV